MPLTLFRKRLVCLLLAWLVGTPLFAQTADSLNVGVNTSIRALQVVNDSVLWFGGNRGWLGRSTDAGKNWKRWQPAGEQADFRTLHAIDEINAIAATTTRPANVLRTHDGGKTWKRVFQSRDTSVFLDGMAFWNDKDGVLFGDPINNRLFLMRTSDGGHNWTPFSSDELPLFAAGEACFAASGTSIRAVGDSTLLIVSGGSVTRLWYSYDRGHTWQHLKTPMIQGNASQGGFGMGLSPDSQLVIVGGDYLQLQDTLGHIANYQDNLWWKNRTTTRGYREAILTTDTFIWLATGPSGSDVSYNGGLDWHSLNNFQGMHTVQQAPTGQAVFLAGSGGVLWRYPQMSRPLLPSWQARTKYGKALQKGDVKGFEKELKQILKRSGKAKKPGLDNDFRVAAEKVVVEIQKLEGVDSAYITERTFYSYFIDGIKVRVPVVVHMRLRTGHTVTHYCLELDKGTYKHHWIKQKLYLTKRLTNPRFKPCPDFERVQYINNQRWRK